MVRRTYGTRQPYDPLVEALESIMAAKKQRQYEQQFGKVSPILARGGGGANIREALAAIQAEKRPTGLGGILDRLNPASPRRGGGSEIEGLLLAELMKERGTPGGIRESLPRFREPTARGGEEQPTGTVGETAVQAPLTDPTMKDPLSNVRTGKVRADMSRMADIIENLWNDPRLGSDKRMLQDLIKAGNDIYGQMVAARKNKEQVRKAYSGSLDVQDNRKIEEADWDYQAAMQAYKGKRGTRYEGVGEMANWAEQRLKKILASEKEGGMPSLDKMMSQAGQMLGEEEPAQGSLRKIGDRWGFIFPDGNVKYVPKPPQSAIEALQEQENMRGTTERLGLRFNPKTGMPQRRFGRGGEATGYVTEEGGLLPIPGKGVESREMPTTPITEALGEPTPMATHPRTGKKVQMPTAPKEERRLVSKAKKRPPKPKEYPNAVWNEEHNMWTIVKNGRLMGIQ